MQHNCIYKGIITTCIEATDDNIFELRKYIKTNGGNPNNLEIGSYIINVGTKSNINFLILSRKNTDLEIFSKFRMEIC